VRIAGVRPHATSGPSSAIRSAASNSFKTIVSKHIRSRLAIPRALAASECLANNSIHHLTRRKGVLQLFRRQHASYFCTRSAEVNIFGPTLRTNSIVPASTIET